MARVITRRAFLSLTAGAMALGLRPGSVAGSSRASSSGPPLPDPAAAPFDTVVVLMMENRSFDHFLGWLPGANGRQQGLSYVDAGGVSHETWPLAPDFQGCLYGDPDHSSEGARIHYANGRCDGFLLTAPVGDRFPIGYYREGDLPIMTALAKGYTVFDSYYCSMLGPTWQNRLYQLTGTTQLTADCDFPKPGEPRPVRIQTAIFDRVRAAGLTAGYYYHAEPMTGIFESRKYDDVSFPIERFWADAANGTLPNVVFVDPNYTDRAEDLGTSNDYHPWGNVLVAEGFVADVHNTLVHSPQWDRMVFVLNFDEDGGFFDHVPPPACQDDTVLADRSGASRPGGGGRFPDLRRLGIRVPAIAMGPFAPRKIHAEGPYEHCSILKMIEWRWALEPLTLRDRTAHNFAEALDLTRRRDPIELPPFTPSPPPTGCAEGGGWTEVPVHLNWLKVPCDGPPGAVCTGRVMVGDTLVATAAPKTIRARGEPVLWMALTPTGRTMIGGLTPRRSLRAVVETTLVEGTGSVCHRSGAVILVPQPLLR